MEYGNYYTEETLRSLNAAYDTLYGITSRETEKVNGIIRRMEKAGRFPPVPQEGDLLEYFPQNGDYWKSHSTLTLLATQNYPFLLKYDCPLWLK
ncbi:MAG: hypothetical protein BHV80_04270 [Phocaeicola vulgatus]|uniref:Uncharacterized protein n=1 Tax=Phocaeicola vulgatus TaxID=821 RepID=A0A1Q6JJL5_PHOVU|nr:MAG: hypothetical protein BHV80_04270 [Phocaeicola vulgatus]